MASNILYWDILSQSRISSTGAKLTDKPFLSLEEYASWELRIKQNVTGTVTAVDLTSCATLEAVVDIDFKHDLVNGALTAGFSGAVTAITVDGVATTPPAAGVLNLTNGSSETEAVAYSSWTLNTGVYTFVVSATLTYVYLNDNLVQIEDTAPCVRVLNAGIVSTSKATGILVLTLDCDTTTFKAAVGTSDYVSGHFDLSGFDVSGKRIFYARFPVDLKNILDPASTIPAGPSSQYYSKAAQDARYIQILSGTQATLTDNTTANITVFDKTTARAAIIDYTITGASGMRQGRAQICFFSSTAYVADNYIEGGASISGISWNADISGNNVRANITLTATGENLKIVYKLSQIALET